MELYDPPTSAVLVSGTTAITGGTASGFLWKSSGVLGVGPATTNATGGANFIGTVDVAATSADSLVKIETTTSGNAKLFMYTNGNEAYEITANRSANYQSFGINAQDYFRIDPNTSLTNFILGLGITVDRGTTLTNQTSAAAAALGTLTNAPAAGNPGFWAKISINGTNYSFPCWLG